MNWFYKLPLVRTFSKPLFTLRAGLLRRVAVFGLLSGVALISGEAFGAAADSASVNGTWKGVYFIYPNLMGLELNLTTAPGGAVSGVLKYYPQVKIRNALGEPKQGSYRVNGQFDERSRSFLLQPGEWIEKPDMAGATAPIAGVLDVRSNQLAGVFQFQSMPVPVFFVLAPESSADKFIGAITNSAYPPPPTQAETLDARQEQVRASFQQQLDNLKKMPRPAGTEENYKKMEEMLRKQMEALAGPGGAKPPGWEPPPVERMQAWLSRFKKEMPDLNLGTTVLNKIYVHALNLFEDDYFKQHFGLAYQDMTTAQRKKVADAFYKHARELIGFEFMARPFQAVGDFGPPDTIVSIHWQRIVRSWLRDVETSFPTKLAAINSFADLDVAESAANAQLPFLWPSEKTRFTSTLTGTRTRLAGPVVTLQVDQLVKTASGNAGARELAGWSTREKKILQYVPAPDQAKFQQRVDARLDEVLGQLVAVDLSALGSFGRGLDAVIAGVKWYQQFEKSYDFALKRPPILAAIQQFQQARAKSLTEARPAMIAQLDASTQEAQVKSILDQYLRCPGDAESETAAALRQHASQRVAAIQRQEMLAMFSDYEKSLMVPPGSGFLDLSKADPKHIPQPDELRLALLRGMAYGTGKMLGPHSAKISTLFGGGSMVVTISDTKKGRYVYVKERNSWMVLYQVDMRFSLPDRDPLWDADPNFRKGAQMAADTVNATAALLSQEDNVQEFRLYTDGWGVPALREEGAGRAGLESLLKGMMKK